MNSSAPDLHQLYEKGINLKFRTVILSDIKPSKIILLVLDINLTVCAYTSFSPNNQILGCMKKITLKHHKLMLPAFQVLC